MLYLMSYGLTDTKALRTATLLFFLTFLSGCFETLIERNQHETPENETQIITQIVHQTCTQGEPAQLR